MTVKERIIKISEHWFLREPLLFSVFCSHEIIENLNLGVPFRTGQRKIEVNSKFIDPFSDDLIEEHLKIEMFRILLKHPYQRLPSFPNRKVLTYASNITITDSYSTPLVLPGIGRWPLPENLCFEEYYARVFAILSNPPDENGHFGETIISPENPSEGETSSHDEEDNKNTSEEESPSHVKESGNIPLEEISELWEENQEVETTINELIEVAESSDSWGTISGKMKTLIKASMKIEMDYRRMLGQFKTSIISNKRRLTRMRPNRRFDFLQMGSRYVMATNILIAIDVSGSVTDKSLSHFFSIINRFFKYGVEKINVIQFDFQLQSKEPMEIKKAKKQIEITGRGGTSFQPAADYYCTHPEYDGLIYFTDGEAPPPIFNTKRVIDVLWVLTGKNQYEYHKNWIKEIKRNKATYIPLPE